MNEYNNLVNQENIVDLKKVFSIMWNRKFFIGSITSMAALLSVIYALYLPNIYSSSALLAPTSQDESLSSKLGSLSGLAGLAGVNIQGGNITNSQIAVKRIQSFEFFSKYFLPNIKLENLMAIHKWSPLDNKIIYDQTSFDTITGKWIRQVSYPKKPMPSNQEAFKEYKKMLNITQEIETGLVYLSIDHQSPFIAKSWVDIIIYNINESMREVDKMDAQNSINFLNETSKSIKVQSIKDVIGKLLEGQMQTLMLASSNKSYVFKTINSPIVSEEKSSPSRALLCILGTFLGFIFSLLIVLVQYFRKLTDI